jgi:cytochrome c550
MNRNPLFPFALIAVLGIALILLLSFKGIGDHEEMANGKDEEGQESEIASASPEEIYQQACISCHGENYEGNGVAPALAGVGGRLDADTIKERIQNGGNGMPANLVPQAKLDDMVEWVSNIK